MFSKPAEPRSIASQLVLRFTPAAAFLLFCALGVLYWIVVRHAFEEDNDVLADKILALRADMSKSGGPQILDRELKNVRPGERVAYWVRILNSAGQLVAETPKMNDSLPPQIFPAAESSSDWKSKDYRRDGQLYSLVAVTENLGGQPYTLQVAQDRSSDERFMKKFGALLVAVLALSIVASAAIARGVARDGLQPLSAMTQSLQRIGPQRLHERIPPGTWPRELQPLAIAFDEISDPRDDIRRFLVKAYAVDADKEGAGLRDGFRLAAAVIDNPVAIETLRNPTLAAIEISRCLAHDFRTADDPGLCR